MTVDERVSLFMNKLLCLDCILVKLICRRSVWVLNTLLHRQLRSERHENANILYLFRTFGLREILHIVNMWYWVLVTDKHYCIILNYMGTFKGIKLKLQSKTNQTRHEKLKETNELPDCLQ